MNKSDSILILGSGGLVGSSLCRFLKQKNHSNILSPKRNELDLLNQKNVFDYLKVHKPKYIINAAAKVGGIHSNNKYRADFIHQNLLIQANLFDGAYKNEIENILFLGSSCIYPKSCKQPMKEEYLLTSELEQTNEPYSIAKIAGLKTAESFKRQYGLNYFSAMPTNLYGVNDNFHPENSHVIPALIQRMAKTIKDKQPTFTIWGTGKPKREFLYVDDLAEACIHLFSLKEDISSWINIGTGEDISIKELAELIGYLMGFKGEFIFDTSKPDGTPRKLLDISKIKSTGWTPKISLEDGLTRTIEYFLNSYNIRQY